MNAAFPLLLAVAAGFSHAFEADHLVAVSTIVTRRATARAALRDGVLWGLGHTSTILLVAGVYLLGRFALRAADFRYLEAGVGAMLVVLGAHRLRKLYSQPDAAGPVHPADGRPAPAHPAPAVSLAYGVGMMHGLAGSGALLLSVLTQVAGPWSGLGYLLVFGAGTVAGMMVAAGAFSLPFSAGLLQNERLRRGLGGLSALVCLALGAKILGENLLF